MGSWGCQCRVVEVGCTKELCMCGQLWVDSGHSQQVEGKCGLWDQAVPEVEREVCVDAGHAGDEVVLEGADGAFCGVAAVHLWWCQLVLDVVVPQVIF